MSAGASRNNTTSCYHRAHGKSAVTKSPTPEQHLEIFAEHDALEQRQSCARSTLRVFDTSFSTTVIPEHIITDIPETQSSNSATHLEMFEAPDMPTCEMHDIASDQEVAELDCEEMEWMEYAQWEDMFEALQREREEHHAQQEIREMMNDLRT